MSVSKSIFPSDPSRLLRNRISPALIFLYQMAAFAILAVVPIIAARWFQLPFLGSLIDPTLMLNTSTPTQPGSWSLGSLDHQYGYQLIEIDGNPVRSTMELETMLALRHPGELAVVTLLAPDGQTISHEIQLQDFPQADKFAFLYVPFLIALVYLLTSIWVFSLRRRDTAGRAFSIFAVSTAITMATLFDVFTTHRLAYLWTASLAISGGALFNLALIFPEEAGLVERYPFLRWAGYVPAAVLIAYSIPKVYNFSHPDAYITGWRLEYIFTGLAFLFFIVLAAIRSKKSISPIAKEQSRLILWASMISFGPLIIWSIISVAFPMVRFTPYLLLPVSAFPVVVAYTILRYRLLKADFIVSQGISYAFLTIMVAVAYALFVSGLGMVVGSAALENNPYMIGAAVFGIAVLANPLRVRTQNWVDRQFSRTPTAYRERLQNFSHELTQRMELEAIVALLRRYVDDNLNPTQFHIFVRDPMSDHYIATKDQSGKITSDLRFASESPLVHAISQRRRSIFLNEADTLPSSWLSERSRLALLGAQLFIPLPGRNQLSGWIAIGPRQSGEPFSDQQVEFVESLSDQAALAIERAQVVENLERRMREMNVLTRISQGINITINFDDILELIYAQTNQLIPSLDFNITLHDNFSNYLYHVFYLENDERLGERENHPLPLGKGLEQEIVESRRPIITDDYERECRSRGLMPGTEGLFAWMGVPLNAGAETIGIIGTGSRDPAVIFIEEQVALLQAIADQAAGAIVKARLLQESERRTRQLTSLNEVARSLTSTLDLDRLLNQILQSAASILNCEAGSLILVDEQTDELVFRVTAGPVASDLLGQRLPPGTGLVGKAVDNRQPIIANDVRRTKEWYEEPDQQTGFVTQDMLVVPMEVKDRVIGVIEVINRRDGLPFTPDDQELLSAFTSQAAVAIENARLYTMTDQALAARVEELSVMQRIDRELNASLEVERAMRITLNWAMRQSESAAGLIGVLTENGLQIMAAQGYPNDLAGETPVLPLDLPSLQHALESGQVSCVEFNDNSIQKGMLESALSQAAIPIRREAEAIGLLLLESTISEGYSEEMLAFLSRLSDHAAIAIANAQLYGEVQAANRAKSDFVSFVSHELKTPMTSIKGFTDLLAAGVVGPVNEAQSNFLSTIRSNVDRMATLVSDLADVSRIEAGRLRLDFSSVVVSEIVEEVARSVKGQIDEKQQTLELNIPADLPAVWGDRMRLIQILTNLTSNAYKYSPAEGKITIKAEATANQWNPNGPPQVVHLSVKDTGYGISPEDQKKIFQKFFRAEDQKIRDAPGTGLGLNITKNLVEMQGGTIWFDTEFREGTTFHFTIPIMETA